MIEAKPFDVLIPDSELVFWVDCPMRQIEIELQNCFTCYYYDSELSDDPEKIVCMYWTSMFNAIFFVSADKQTKRTST